MNLYEYEAKALLARHGVVVPRGAVWPDIPPTDQPLVVKAQILGGKRGKQGGIRFVAGPSDCREEAESMLGSQIAGHEVNHVYIEERLSIERELYVALVIDRDRWSPLLLVSQSGGMDVEDAPDTAMIRLPIDPWLGLRPFALRYVANSLGLTGTVAEQAIVAIQGLYEAFKSSDAQLVEVNPLVITTDGRVIAADAKITLDDAAAFRHPERQTGSRVGSEFERECASRGTVGVEMDGDVAIVVSGAGLMMATVDLLGAAGVRLRAAVDLGGVAFGTPEQSADILRLVSGLSPKVILVNAFFNLAMCDPLAQGIVSALGGQGYEGRLVVRLRGRNLAEATAILAPLGIAQFEELQDAVDCVIGAKEVDSSRS